MSDKYKNALRTIDSVCEDADNIVPNDAVDLPRTSRALYVGSTGDITVQLVNSVTSITLKNVVAGSLLPLRIKRVFATSTTATALIALL